MTAIIKANPQLPAAIAKLVALATPQVLNELSGGVTSGFPIISYKGKVWRLRKGGEEAMHLDDQGNALPTIDVILVQANPLMSKIFYEKQFEEGTNEAPRCFSNDGIKPDAGVQNPINPTCANCPNNAWGSRITPQGKKARACSDARRMAVVFAQDLYENGEDAVKYLLRVPPASLNPLKDYAEKVLAPKGIPFFAVATRIGFDPQVAHPQMTFRPARLVNDEEAEAIVNLRGSADVQRILAEAQEFPAAGAGAGAGEAEASADAPAPEQAASSPTTPAAAKQKPAAKPRPATDEEAGDAAIQPPPPPAKAAAAAPKPKPAPTPPPAEPEGELMAPPPPRKGAKKAAAPSPAVAAAPPPAPAEEEEAETPVAGAKAPAGFDDLLDSILNG